MKNILVCCPVYAPHAGGGGQYFPLLVSQLLSFDKTDQVIVLTEYHPAENFYNYENGTHVYRLLPQRDTKINKTIINSRQGIECPTLMSNFLLNNRLF